MIFRLILYHPVKTIPSTIYLTYEPQHKWLRSRDRIHKILRCRQFTWVWIYFCFTSHATVFQSYMWRHRCAGGLKKKLYLRSGSQRHRHFVGFFNVPVLHHMIQKLCLWRETNVIFFLLWLGLIGLLSFITDNRYQLTRPHDIWRSF